ncbi:MAG: helix-hairpin-helix domain-containing protein [Alcaligenaceae bacterium]|nr:helix-hairpin-helix domain-containing protein [Alcaligenaceae bacterium SAGV5]MPS52586.1 helix-hairpin-helix domain-containing protein [Alcaligenaceae bacterium SAGV3]MPT60331.1 helix-hairpin-helix domain-containing protein [Alcaligenaceae bacterium]
MTPDGVAAAGAVAGNFHRSLAMNPFLDPTRAEPDPRPYRLRGARRCAGRLAVVAGLGLAALGGVQAASVDVNSATPAQLEAVRGIGPRTAATIVQERRRGGPFSSFEDLSGRVRGLGGKRLQGLRAAGLSIGPAGREAPPILVNMPPGSKGKGN